MGSLDENVNDDVEGVLPESICARRAWLEAIVLALPAVASDTTRFGKATLDLKQNDMMCSQRASDVVVCCNLFSRLNSTYQPLRDVRYFLAKTSQGTLRT